jgi:hypothetical protein
VFGLEDDDFINGLHSQQSTRMARMPWLTPTTVLAPRLALPLMLS